MKPINEISIAVCSDHAGYELKQTVMKHLTDQGVIKLKDFERILLKAATTPIMRIQWLWLSKVLNLSLHFHLWKWKWYQHDCE